MAEIEIRRPGDLGRLIGSVRSARGIRQEDLAEELGVARSYLAAMESGRVTVQLARLFRGLRALGIRVTVSVDLVQPHSDEDAQHARR